MNKLSAFILSLAILALACSNTPAVIAEPVKPATVKTISESVKTMAVCVDALNVRIAPGTGNQTVGEPLERGIFVTMTGSPVISADGGTWQEISMPLKGYVNTKYLCNGD